MFLEPNNLDNSALAALNILLSDEKLTGAWQSLGPGSSTGRTDAPSEGQGTASVDVIVK